MELLAPAGSLEALQAAIAGGADAVYFGLAGFNARDKAENCEPDTMERWLDTCHIHGVKAYVAANTLVKDDEWEAALEKICEAYRLGADAFIVQDIGLASEINRCFPAAALHLSTQAGIGQPEAVRLLREKLGFTRVILPRECSAREVADVAATDVETEIFAHGALCVAFSGNCYFSSMATGNSGNRGRCQQFCRTAFSAEIGGRKAGEGYLLSPKDLCLLEHVAELKALGVASIKLEGRMKRAEYVAEVTRCYRKALDGERVTNADIDRLKAIYNRGGFTKGYLTTRDGIMFKEVQGHLGLRVGKISALSGVNATVVSARPLHAGDGFKVLTDGRETGSARFLEACGSAGKYKLRVSGRAQAGSEVYLTTDSEQLADLATVPKREPIRFAFYAKAGEAPQLTASACGETVSVTGASAAEFAVRAPLTREHVARQLNKLNDTVFAPGECEVTLSGPLFLPVSALNELRREAVEALYQKIVSAFRRKADLPLRSHDDTEKSVKTGEIAIILRDFKQYHSTMSAIARYILYDPDEYLLEKVEADRETAANCYLSLPYYLGGEDREAVKPLLPYFKGVYANAPYAVALAREAGVELFCGELNCMNTRSAAYWRDYTPCVSISREATLAEAQQIARRLGGTAPFVPVFGPIPLMQLTHCPIKNATGCDCADCRYRDDVFYTDAQGRRFPLRRKRIKTCLFLLYNEIPQNALAKGLPAGVNYILDLSDLCREYALEILTAVASGGPIKTAERTTGGHLYRGVK